MTYEEMYECWEVAAIRHQRKRQAEDVRDIAWELYQRGELSLFDYALICHRNKVLIF